MADRIKKLGRTIRKEAVGLLALVFLGSTLLLTTYSVVILGNDHILTGLLVFLISIVAGIAGYKYKDLIDQLRTLYSLGKLGRI